MQQFLLACKDLGVGEDQLFDMMDLQDPSTESGDRWVSESVRR